MKRRQFINRIGQTAALAAWRKQQGDEGLYMTEERKQEILELTAEYKSKLGY